MVGGKGTRMGGHGLLNRPKGMMEIGGKPIVCHIMDIYARHGHTEFILAAGYKRSWFKKHFNANPTPYNVIVEDTGSETQTGGRLKQFEPEATFMATYGDGVGNIDISKLLKFHKQHGRLATLTAVRPPARFGALALGSSYFHDTKESLWGAKVEQFNEKHQAAEGWINGGFFVLEPGVLDYIEGADTKFEEEPLSNLAKDGQLMAYLHGGFWQPMDTMKELDYLRELAKEGTPPWLT